MCITYVHIIYGTISTYSIIYYVYTILLYLIHTGYTYYSEELIDLCTLIDSRNTGVMEYNSYITHIMIFLRLKYHEVCNINIDTLHICFNSIDYNHDGALNHNEFRYLAGTATSAGQG